MNEAILFEIDETIVNEDGSITVIVSLGDDEDE